MIDRETDVEKRRDDALRRALNTPPQPRGKKELTKKDEKKKRGDPTAKPDRPNK